MNQQLSGKKILVLVANGVDEAAVSQTQRELLKTGAVIRTAGLAPGLVNSWNVSIWGLYFPVDQQVSQTLGSDFDALVVPSGSRGIEKLAASPHTERILSSFIAARKPMVMIGDASTLFAKTGVAMGPSVWTGELAQLPEALDHIAAEAHAPIKAAA